MKSSYLKFVLFLSTFPLALLFLVNWFSLVIKIETEDKENHLLSLMYGVTKPTEPLWGLLAPAIGHVFPESPFEAAGILAATMIAIGTLLNKYRLLSIYTLLISPAVVYMISMALRQGMALGIFLILIGLLRIHGLLTRDIRGFIYILAASIPSILIHNSVVIVSIYLFIMLAAESIESQRNSIVFQAKLFSVALFFLIIDRYLSGSFTGTALLLVSCQFVLIAFSVLLSRSRDNFSPFACLLFFSCLGFLLTITGLRVFIMLLLVTPIIFQRLHIGYLILGLWFYPILSSYLSGGNADAFIPVF